MAFAALRYAGPRRHIFAFWSEIDESASWSTMPLSRNGIGSVGTNRAH